MDNDRGRQTDDHKVVEAMWSAIIAGDAASVSELAANKIDVNRLERGEYGGTDTFLSEALHQEEVNIDVIRALLEAGADPNQYDSSGTMPLSLAISSGSIEVVQLLVQFGADVNWPSSQNGITPLMDAVWEENPAIFKYLLALGADPKVTNADGKNLYQWARSNGIDLKPYLE